MAYIPLQNTSVSGTVGASIIGLTPVSVSNLPTNQSVSGTIISTQIAGSIMAISGTLTPPANQSVSGQIGASIIGLTPVKVSNFPTNQSVSGQITVVSSIAGGIFPISGSVAAVVTNFPANQSVSGQIVVVSSIAGCIFPISGSVSAIVTNLQGASVSGTVVATQIAGSVMAVGGSLTMTGNQSVSGTVGASIIGQVTVVSSIAGGIFPISGSVAATVTNFPSNQSVSGTIHVDNFSSVVATQLAGSIMAVSATAAANQSVSGTVHIDNFSSVAATITNTVTVVSSIAGGIFPISGSVAAVITNTPTVTPNFSSIIAINAGSVVALSQGSVITVGQGSIAAVIIGGSIAASFTPPANQSVSGTVVTTQIAGSVMAVSGSFAPAANQSVSGTVHVDNISSIIAYQVAGSIMAVSATLTPVANQSVSGTIQITDSVGSVLTSTTNHLDVNIASGNASISGQVGASIIGSVPTTQAGTWISSVVNTVPSSMLVGASIIGLTPVSATQITSPWVVNFQNSSIIGINAGSVVSIIPGSVITIQQANSIVGTYLEDAGSASGDRGIFTLGVRNDTVASMVSANLDYGAFVIDSIGRTINKPFAAEEATWHYTGSVVSGSVTLMKASTIGLKNYITDYQIANTGSVATLVTFQGGDTSIVGYSIAPAGGGSNVEHQSPPNSNASQDLSFKMSTPVSVLYLSVNGFVAP